jgi:hypothetical protein
LRSGFIGRSHIALIASTLAEFAAVLRSESLQWVNVIKDARIKLGEGRDRRHTPPKGAGRPRS